MKTPAVSIFGIGVILSGIYRIVSAEGGTTGLFFGLITGGIALAGSFLMRSGKPLPGLIAAWISIALVGGWFSYEALVKKGITNAEPRQLIIIGLTLVTAVVLLLPRASSKNAVKTGV